MTDEPPKVFISHNSLDKGTIVPLLQRLNEDFQVETWLDEWDLRPAHEWEPAIERDLRACNSCAVFLGANGWGKHHIVEVRLALAYKERNPNFTVIPILLSGARAEDMAVFGALFSRQHRVDFTDGMENEEAFRRLVAAIRGEAPGPPPLTLFTIKRDASQWHQMPLKDKASVLYRGAELRQAQGLARLHPPEKLTDLALRFLLESETEEQRQLERERARNRRIIFGLTVGLISISAATVYAVFKRNEAVAQRDKAAQRLVAQRILNGTRAAVDGDLWGAWSWYANALQLAQQSNLDERAHRERLGGLRWQVPHLRQVWFAEGKFPAAVVSPDAETVAITQDAYSSLPAGAAGPVIELFRVKDGARFAEIQLGPRYLSEMSFSPRGDELWTLRYAHNEGGSEPRLIAAIHSLPEAALKASHEIKAERAQSRWLDAHTLAVIDDRAAHLLRFRDGAVVVDTVEAPPGAKMRAVSLDGSLYAAYTEKGDRLLIGSAGRPWDKAHSLDVGRYSPVIFSPDGKHLITVEDQTLAVWQLGGKPEKVLGPPLGGSVVAHQFDRAGRLLLTKSRGNGSHVSTLWRVETATLLKSFDHEKILSRWEFPADARGGTSLGSGAVAGFRAINPFERRAVLSDDGQRLITVSESTRSYRVWDMETAEALTPPLSHGRSELLSVSFSRDGRAVVSSAHDGTTKFWDAALPRRFKPLIGQPGVVSALHFTGGGERLLSVSNKKARLLDWNTGREVASLGAGLELEEAWLAAGGRVVAGRQSDRFRLWNAETFAPLSNWLEHASVRGAAVSENGLYAASWDFKYDTPPRVRLWDIRQGKLIDEFTPSEKYLVAASIDERQKLALFVHYAQEGRGHDLVVHNLETKETSRPQGFQNFSFEGLFYSEREGCWIGFDGHRFWRLARPDLDETRPYSTSTGSLTKFLTSTGDGTRAVLADGDGLIAQVVDVRTGEPLTPEFRHEWKITRADINAEGTRLLTVSGNKAHLWDLTTGDALVPVVRYPQTVTASALHPAAGTFAVSAEREVGDHRFAIFVESLAPETADPAALVAYGEVNGEQRVDAAGGRLPLSVRELADTWSSLLRRDPAVLQEPCPPVDWFRQLEAESGRYILQRLYYLDKILALAPDDLYARLERAALHRDEGEAAADLLRLIESGAFDQRLDLTTERVRLYCRLLLQAQRPREAFRVVRHQGVPAEGQDGWLLALVSHAAGEFDAHRQHCEAMLRVAEALGRGNGQWQERWNAAFYSARACLPAEGAGPQLDAAVALAAAAAQDGEATELNLQLLRGAAALRAGSLPAAEASLRGLESVLLGKLLIAEVLLRKGEDARARALLSELTKDLSAMAERHDGHWLELADIEYLKRALEAKARAGP